MEVLIRKRIRKALLLVLSVFAVGTVGFWVLLDNLAFIDALYLTIITLTTVGYGDFTPHTHMPANGNPYIIKLFTITIILVGMGSVLYVVSVATEYLLSGEMIRKRREKRMRKLISTMRNHYIICGAGRAGVYMMQELQKTRRPFVVIERSEERLMEVMSEFRDLMYLTGDATSEELINQAGLEHAAGIVAALPDEKDNLVIVMSMGPVRQARGEGFRIASKVEHFTKMAPKMRSAGADCVISPERISSRRMLSEMFRPSVTTFLDRMLRDDRAVMRIEEAVVGSGSQFDGKTLREARIPDRTGLIIAAIRKGGLGGFIVNPGADQGIDAGDVLIAMGEMDKIFHLRKLAKGR